MPFGGMVDIFWRWACRCHPKVTVDRECTRSELDFDWKRIRINLWSNLSEPEEVLYVVWLGRIRINHGAIYLNQKFSFGNYQDKSLRGLNWTKRDLECSLTGKNQSKSLCDLSEPKKASAWKNQNKSLRDLSEPVGIWRRIRTNHWETYLNQRR